MSLISYMEGYNMTILRIVMWLLSFLIAFLGVIMTIHLPELRTVGLLMIGLGIFRFIYVTEQINK